MLELSGALTWKDSLQIYWLSIRPRPAWAVVGVVLSALALFLMLQEWQEFFAGGLAPSALSYSVLVLMFFVYYPWVFFRAYAKSNSLSLPVTFRFEPEQIVVSNELSTTRVPWAHITSVRENRRAYLLYEHARPMVGIPKRLASADQLKELAQYIKSRGVVA